jgi:hypothetical protein
MECCCAIPRYLSYGQLRSATPDPIFPFFLPRRAKFSEGIGETNTYENKNPSKDIP